MRKLLITETLIQAPMAEVWRILTDFPGYPQWNPFITRISDSLQTGARLHVRIQLVGGKAMFFSPQVLCCELPELRWQGRTKLVHGECFSGLQVGLFAHSLENGFKQMNEALKQKAERAGLMPA